MTKAASTADTGGSAPLGLIGHRQTGVLATAFGKKKGGAPPEPLTTEQLIARHQTAAEALLARAGKAGRLEPETRLATMATAHATLAVSYLLSPPAEDVIIDLDDEGTA